MDEIYRIKDQSGKEFGPLPAAHVLALIDAGLVDAKSKAKAESASAYVPIAELDAFMRLFEQTRKDGDEREQAPPALPSSDLLLVEGIDLELPDLSVDLSQAGEEIEEFIQITSDLQQQLSDCLSGSRAYDATWVDYWNFEDPEADSLERSDEEALIGAAWSSIEAAEYSDALRLFDALIQNQPAVPSHQAGASYARFLRDEHHSHKIAELTAVERLAASNPRCVRTLICASRMNLALNRPRLASEYLAKAHNLHPDRVDLKNALDTADHLISRFGRRRAQAKPRPQVDKTPQRSAPSESAQSAKASPRKLATLLSLYIGVVALIATLGITIHLDVGGRRYDPSQGFFWVRRAILLFSGVVGSLTLYKRAAFSIRDFVFKPLPIALALGLGLAGGYFSRFQAVEVGIATALGMTLFHVIAEEIFFRFLIDRGLQRALPQVAAPAIISGVLFGLYHLSYHSVWAGSSALSKLSTVGLITCFAGLPYAYLYHKTKSLIPPFVCHLTVNVAATLLSLKL